MKRKFAEWEDLLVQADLTDNAVFRWWLIHLMLQIHGDLDSISYCVRELLAHHVAEAAVKTGRVERPSERAGQTSQTAAARPVRRVEVPPARGARR